MQPSSLIPTVPFTIAGKVLALRVTPEADYRLGAAGLPESVPAKNPVFGVCNLLWAYDTTATFESPKAIAKLMNNEDVGPAIEAIRAAIKAATPPEEEEKKSPSPAGPEPASH